MVRFAFPSSVKQLCWERAKKILGRDPNRWREDAVGTPILKGLYGKNGLCGWQYDHIRPPKSHEDSKIENCQILQSQTNNRKDSKVLTLEEIKKLAPNIKLTGWWLDFVEMVVHGNVKDQNGAYKCKCISAREAEAFKIRDNATPCQFPEPLHGQTSGEDHVQEKGKTKPSSDSGEK